jgi:hypothetical protein
VNVVAKNIRLAEDKERGKVTKADGRRKQHVEFGIVNSATKRAERNDNVKDHGSRGV